MFGKTVLRHRRATTSSSAIETPSRAPAARPDIELGVDDLKGLVDAYKGDRHGDRASTSRRTRASSSTCAIQAVFHSWNTDRARLTGARSASPPTSAPRSTSGHGLRQLGDDSGTGVAFTRDPATGAPGHLRRLPAERPGRGRRLRRPQHPDLDDMGRIDAAAHAELLSNMDVLEQHYHDLCDIEFTVEHGTLWMLQTRVGQADGGRGVPDRHPAGRRGRSSTWTRPLRRVNGAQLGAADVPAVRTAGRAHPAGQGHRRLARRRRRRGCVRLRDRGGAGPRRG